MDERVPVPIPISSFQAVWALCYVPIGHGPVPAGPRQQSGIRRAKPAIKSTAKQMLFQMLLF
jgi:hypothetical protein